MQASAWHTLTDVTQVGRRVQQSFCALSGWPTLVIEVTVWDDGVEVTCVEKALEGSEWRPRRVPVSLLREVAEMCHTTASWLGP